MLGRYEAELSVRSDTQKVACWQNAPLEFLCRVILGELLQVALHKVKMPMHKAEDLINERVANRLRQALASIKRLSIASQRHWHTTIERVLGRPYSRM